jgi:hypothetical protein
MTGELGKETLPKELVMFPREVTFSAKRLFCANVATFARS